MCMLVDQMQHDWGDPEHEVLTLPLIQGIQQHKTVSDSIQGEQMSAISELASTTQLLCEQLKLLADGMEEMKEDFRHVRERSRSLG